LALGARQLFLRDFVASLPQSEDSGQAMIKKPDQTKRWALEEAIIKAEVNEAKKTIDLMRMAKAITRLDALHAEMQAASEPLRDNDA
jgi:hypothetical protein